MESKTTELLQESRFDYVSAADKAFMTAFDAALLELGWGLEHNGHYKGYCWGRHMFIYYKLGVKSKQVAARIFIRKNGIVLWMFFNNIDKHSAYIENALQHIKDVFTGEHGKCNGDECKGIKINNKCRYKKTYTIDGRLIEKCSGVVFEFWQPNLEKLPDYVGLLKEFYAGKK